MTKSALKIDKLADLNEEKLLKAFPDVDPEIKPFGSRIVVQLRCPKTVTDGGIELSLETIETEMWNTQIGKVRSIGPVAFRNRATLEPWPEGDWASVGDYVRIPKFNQDKWFMEFEDTAKDFAGRTIKCKGYILFMLINDLDLLGKKIGNPLNVKAYI
jgi:co-chaperonin GroES (HSP10)